MNLLIHDLSAEEWAQIADSYKNWTVISDTGAIRPCIGCFNCWVSGTGACIFKDGFHQMCALIHEAEEMVVMSRYTYGGFSSFVKGVWDRSIGYVLPEFETAYGEMHHQKRFPQDRPVTFRFRGTEFSTEDKEKARAYVSAVCRNLRGTVQEVIFDEIAPVQETKTPAGASERAGIVLINCSMRGNGSNTGVFLDRLRAEIGSSAAIDSLSVRDDPEKIAAAIDKADTVVLGAPLYVDGLPASALRFMEKVQRQSDERSCKLYALVNNGLYESRQNVNMLSMIRDFCKENGIRYCGAVAIGAGEAIGALMRGKDRPLWPARNAVSGISRQAKAVTAGCELGEIYADPFLFPRWMYILIANTNWQLLKKAYQSERQGGTPKG